MEKLKLVIEDLGVETFAADALESARGTVVGQDTYECSGGCTDPGGPATWTQDPYNTRCCYTWALDSRCADSMETSPEQCACWPVTQWADTSC